MYIETKRLVLKPMEDKDQSNMVAMLKNDIIKATYMVPDFDDDSRYVRMFELYKRYSNDATHFCVGIHLNDELIGVINDVEFVDTTMEFGYFLNPKYHNLGYTTEAVDAYINAVLKTYITEVHAGAFSHNKASIRVMEKCGMQKLEKEEYIDYRQKSHHCVYFGRKK